MNLYDDETLETISLFNDNDNKKEENIKPCDYKSRLWCLRMFALFIIIILLIAMILNTFEYYTSMVKDMDNLMELTPSVVALYDKCKYNHYNVINIDNQTFRIKYIPEQLATIFIQTIPYLYYELDNDIISLNTTHECFSIIVWGIV